MIGVVLLLILFRIIHSLLKADDKPSAILFVREKEVAEKFYHSNASLLNLQDDKFISPEIVKKAYYNTLYENDIESSEVITTTSLKELTAAKNYLLDRCSYFGNKN